MLSLLMKRAVRQKLISANPVDQVERLREQPHEWRILHPEEVARLFGRSMN